MIHIEFFHDAVCGWCYVLSPRLRQIAALYPVQVTHRTFVLQRNQAEMIARFGSVAQAKTEILSHWQRCQQFSDDPSRFNINGMRQREFDYPTGYLAALYCKAVELRFGQQQHWDYFDLVQRSHLYHNDNIADASVLQQLLTQMQLPVDEILAQLASAETRAGVDADSQRAASFGIRSIPTLLINGSKLVSQCLTLTQLTALIENEIKSRSGDPK